MEKFLGVGLKTALALWLFFVILTVVAKVALAKVEVPGVSSLIQAV